LLVVAVHDSCSVVAALDSFALETVFRGFFRCRIFCDGFGVILFLWWRRCSLFDGGVNSSLVAARHSSCRFIVGVFLFLLLKLHKNDVQEDTKSRKKDAQVEPKEAEEESLKKYLQQERNELWLAHRLTPIALEMSHRWKYLLKNDTREEAKNPLAKSLKVDVQDHSQSSNPGADDHNDFN
jgi:hypothetical protein